MQFWKTIWKKRGPISERAVPCVRRVRSMALAIDVSLLLPDSFSAKYPAKKVTSLLKRSVF
jgi:hypothetical protein